MCVRPLPLLREVRRVHSVAFACNVQHCNCPLPATVASVCTTVCNGCALMQAVFQGLNSIAIDKDQNCCSQ